MPGQRVSGQGMAGQGMAGQGAPGQGAPREAVSGQAAMQVAVVFGRVLRAAGLDVPIGSVVGYAQALASLGLGNQAAAYWAGRATLVKRPEDIPTYDAAFEAYWLGRLSGPGRSTLEVPVAVTDDGGIDPATGADSAGTPATRLAVRYSAEEVLRAKDFAACTPAELAETYRLMANVRLRSSRRRSRRRVPARRRGSRPDLRRTVRQAIRASGEPIRRAWSEPGDRPRRVVLLCDVSGSMEAYARALLRFCHVAVAGGTSVEAFTLGTRLTRVTRELSQHDPDLALERAARTVDDWSGGTRLGEGIGAFNRLWGVPGMARGAIVVILSDGWDRGDSRVLADEMSRLRRVAHRVVWVNPLKARPGYTPVARGMAAALPYVDDLVEGHSLASLESLADLVAR
ncbi:MAG: vWA domain-containing protein [Acidimicrobiales bacterium]